MPRTSSLRKSQSDPFTFLPDGGNGSRKQRLLIVALQIPVVDNLLREIARQKVLRAQERRFNVWKEFAVKKREIDNRLKSLRNASAKTIQCLVRCFLSRRRVAHRRVGRRMAREKQQNEAATRIQSFFRCILACKRVERMRRIYPEHLRNKAAMLIQRVFRGFLGRGIVLNIERRKLLRFLRNWSRGKTAHLFQISVLQEIDAQATIYTAISFAMLPSKPLRNLPSMKTLRQYRAGLLALHWQIQSRFVARREDKMKRRTEKQQMMYEDLYSHAYESVVKAHILKEKQTAALEEEYRRAQEREAAKRAQYLEQQTMLNLHNKQQLKEREEKEILWRKQEIERRDEEWLKAAVQREYDREWEMMTAEDGWAAALRAQAAEHQRQQEYLKEEATKVHQARVHGWLEKKYIESRRMRATLTEVALRSHLERYEANVSSRCVEYLKSLPFAHEIQLHFQQKFLGEYSTSMKELVIQRMLMRLLEDKQFSYRLVQKELLVLNATMQQKKETANQSRLVELLEYLQLRMHVDENIRRLLKNRAVLSHLSPLSITGKVLKIDHHHHFFAREEFLYGVPLQFKMHLPANNIAQYAHLLEYKHLKRLNRTTFRSLSIALARFKQIHQKLKLLRQEIKEGKFLRSARKEKLDLASRYEEILFESRQQMIDDGMLLYDSVYYEIRLFLDLFYPSESNYYYRTMNAIFESPSAMRMRSQSSDNTTTSSGAAAAAVDVPPAPSEKPMTPGSPHSGARRKSALRHSVDGSSAAGNEARVSGDIAEALFQSPDQRNSPHRKRSFSGASSDGDNSVTTTASETSASSSSLSAATKGSATSTPDQAAAQTTSKPAAASTSPKDSNTLKSNRRKGNGMARDTARRRSMGSTEDATGSSSSSSSNPFAHGSPGPHLNAANRTASKLKLPTRKYNYLIDDPEDYWEDLLEVSTEAYALLPTEIVALLPAPPKPTFNHDGHRHILKVKSILVQQSHYGPNGPIARPSMQQQKSPTKKARVGGGVSFGNSPPSTTTSSSPPSGSKGHIRWAKKRDVFTPMGPQAKERKFFDIPGENAFMEKDIDKYDFFHWAHGVYAWAKEIVAKNANLSQAWKSKHERQLLAYLHAHRIEYLLDVTEETPTTGDGTATTTTTTTSAGGSVRILPDHSSYAQAAKNVKLQQLIQSAAVDAADIYDLLLCHYDVAITAKVNVGRGKVVESSVKVAAAELDFVMSRQPFSYVARQTMIQGISEWFTRYFSMYPENLQPSNARQLREFWAHPLIPWTASWQQEELDIFPIIAKEYDELRDLARVMLDNQLVAFDAYNQKLLWHTTFPDPPAATAVVDGSTGAAVLASPTRLAALRNKLLRNVGVTIVQTADVYLAAFPRFMQPVFRFGVPAPPESFQKQLLREKKAGIVGKYTKIDAKDAKIDICARKLLAHVFKRCLLKRFLLDCWQAQELVDYDREGMMLEDARALLIRKAEKEERQRQREKSCTYRFARTCMGIVVGAFLCRPLGPPRIFPGHELDRFDDAYRRLRRTTFAQLHRRYLPTVGVSTDYQPPPDVLTTLMRRIVENHYVILGSDRVQAVRQSHEMFRVIDDAIWEALEQDLADIDAVHITERSHFRLHSWYTGQVVAVNTTTGNQMDLRALLQEHLPAMSEVYREMSQLPSSTTTANTTADAAASTSTVSASPASSKSGALAAFHHQQSSSSLLRSALRPKHNAATTAATAAAATAMATTTALDANGDSAAFDERALTTTLQQSLKRDKYGRSQLHKLTSTLASPMQATAAPPLHRQRCPEYWIAGGLHRAVVALRLVEHERVNERGIIVVEDIEIPTTAIIDLPHIRRTYRHHVPEPAVPPEMVPGSPLAMASRKSATAASSSTATTASSTATSGKTTTATATKTPSPTNKGVGTSTTTSNRRKGRAAATTTTAAAAAGASSNGSTNSNPTAASGKAATASSAGATSPTASAASTASTVAANATGSSATTKSNYRRKNALTSNAPLLPATVLQKHQQQEQAALQRHYALLASGRGLDGDYNDTCIALIVRGGFTYHPLCTCCAFSASSHWAKPQPPQPIAAAAGSGEWVAQWGDAFHGQQKRYYCRWHWLRIHARHAYHPQHDTYYQYRTDWRFLRRDLFPIWHGAEAGHRWSSASMAMVGDPERMREDVLRLVLCLRYRQVSPWRADLFRTFVRLQARIRGACVRLRLERERQATAAAMASMLRAQAQAEIALQRQRQGLQSAGSGGSGSRRGSTTGQGRLSQVLHPGGALRHRLSGLSSHLSQATGSQRDHVSVGVASPSMGGSPTASVKVRKRLSSHVEGLHGSPTVSTRMPTAYEAASSPLSP